MLQNFRLKNDLNGYFYAMHICHIKGCHPAWHNAKYQLWSFSLVSQSKLKCAKPSTKNIIKGRLSYCVKWGKIRKEAEVLEREK